MKVEIWSEVTCPWCGLGSHRLDRAVERFDHAGEVEVIHRSFPISGSFPGGTVFSVCDALLRRYGLQGAQAEASTRHIEQLAAAEGLSPYRVLDNQVGNTDLAHEFLAHASAQGKNRAAWAAIFRAYFGQARRVFGLDDLLALAGELGLDADKTRRVLGERRYQRQVQDEAARA
ncbi:DsbA family protein, partial [Streptomyces spiralis]